LGEKVSWKIENLDRGAANFRIQRCQCKPVQHGHHAPISHGIHLYKSRTDFIFESRPTLPLHARLRNIMHRAPDYNGVVSRPPGLDSESRRTAHAFPSFVSINSLNIPPFFSSRPLFFCCSIPPCRLLYYNSKVTETPFAEKSSVRWPNQRAWMWG
jgi:hypothetical protein